MNKRYAVTDIHGMWNLWEQIYYYCDQDDVIYFLGDAADRGADGIKIMRALLADKRVRYIRGNHEEMLVDAAETFDPFLLLYNGGEKTYEDFMQMDYMDQQRLIDRLKILPNQLEYINTKGQRIILNHSGSTPESYDKWEKSLFKKGTNLYTWDRHHFHREWDGDDNTIVVHGHTPVPHVITSIDPTGKIYGEQIEADEVFRYCDGHKIDLDICSALTKKIALFDLDELKVEKYFKVED